MFKVRNNNREANVWAEGASLVFSPSKYLAAAACSSLFSPLLAAKSLCSKIALGDTMRHIGNIPVNGHNKKEMHHRLGIRRALTSALSHARY